MEGVASVSIMFDEASDIQMHKHLNVFVNVSVFLCCIFVGIQSTSSVAIPPLCVCVAFLFVCVIV